MRGSGDEIGLVPRFARDLIHSIENTDFAIYASFIQIYKEWTFDLLRVQTIAEVKLRIEQGIMSQTDEEEGDEIILETKIRDFAHFINVLGEAINKREANSSMKTFCVVSNLLESASSLLKKKFHLVIRLKLVDENSAYRILV